MTDYGIEADPNGVDNSVPNEELYSSDQISPKLLTPISGTFTTDSSGNSITVNSHGLAYTPVALAYVKHPDDDGWYTTDNVIYFAEVDSANVTIKTNNAVANANYNYKLWVFQDPAQVLQV